LVAVVVRWRVGEGRRVVVVLPWIVEPTERHSKITDRRLTLLLSVEAEEDRTESSCIERRSA
jgi:hypothetical protein